MAYTIIHAVIAVKNIDSPLVLGIVLSSSFTNKKDNICINPSDNGLMTFIVLSCSVFNYSTGVIIPIAAEKSQEGIVTFSSLMFYSVADLTNVTIPPMISNTIAMYIAPDNANAIKIIGKKTTVNSIFVIPHAALIDQ